MGKKFVIIDVDSVGDYDDSCECISTVEIVENISDLVAKIGTDIFLNLPAIKLLLNNPVVVKALDQHGFRKTDRLINIQDRLKAERRFYRWDQSNSYYGYQNLYEIDLDNIQQMDIDVLSRQTSLLLQSIDKSTLKDINLDAHKKLVACRKRIEAANKAKAEKAKERAEKKKLKQIEDAKKLLEENNDN